MTKYDTLYTGCTPPGSHLYTGRQIGIGGGEEEAGLPNALLGTRGSIFQNSVAGFRIVGKPGPTMKIDPPPSRFVGELRPLLATGWTPARVSRHQHLDITPNGSAVNPEGFGQPLLISGCELSRGDQFHQCQAAFVGEPSALGVVPVTAGHKVQHLLLTYEVYTPASFTFHALRITFLTCLTQVLGASNRGFTSTEILLIADSLDKSNDICIIVCTGMKGIDDRVGFKRLNDQHPMTRPDTSSNLVISILTSGYSEVRLSRLLWKQEIIGSNPVTQTYGKVAELGIRYRLRPGCSQERVGSIPTFPTVIGNLEMARGSGRVPRELGNGTKQGYSIPERAGVR